MTTNLHEPKAPSLPTRTPAQPPPVHQTRDARLQRRLVETTAALCAASGFRRIALCGGQADVTPIVRQPWLWHNVEVVAIVSPTITTPTVRGVPVVRPASLPPGTDAVVVCAERDEHRSFEHVQSVRERGVPILRIYYEDPAWEQPTQAIERLTRCWNVPPEEARWLVANRGERHDATLPMLLPRRTELHLRRYEFASAYTRGLRVADIACGTGYGSRLLMSEGAASSVVGLDIDAAAVSYAACRFAAERVTFGVADGTATGLASGSVDLITSFETIEHVPDARALLAEFARILTPRTGRGGKLVLSTPNDWGPTDHHVHSFSPAGLGELIQECFTIDGWWSQLDSSAVRDGGQGLPEGIAPMASLDEPAETVLLVATVRS